MNSFQNRRKNDDSSVFIDMNDAYADWKRNKNDIDNHVVKISFIDTLGRRHQYFNDTIENLKKCDLFMELATLNPSIFTLHNDTTIWFDRPFDFTYLNKVTKIFRVIEVLSDQEFIRKYNII
jgi:hypothetical protein